jgi:hypothetical protein
MEFYKQAQQTLLRRKKIKALRMIAMRANWKRLVRHNNETENQKGWRAAFYDFWYLSDFYYVDDNHIIRDLSPCVTLLRQTRRDCINAGQILQLMNEMPEDDRRFFKNLLFEIYHRLVSRLYKTSRATRREDPWLEVKAHYDYLYNLIFSTFP